MKIVHPNSKKKSVNALFVSPRLIVNVAFVSNMRKRTSSFSKS